MLGRRLGDSTFYDCASCATNPTMMQLLGHDGEPQSYWRENLISGAPLTECPLRSVLRARETRPALAAEIDRYIDVYHPAYLKGFLLIAGGVVDQPARYHAMIQLIDDAWATVDAKHKAVTAGDGAGAE